MNDFYSDADEKKAQTPEFKLTLERFLNQMTVIWGSSGSGKTFFLKDIMYVLKDHIPDVFAIVPSNEAAPMYDEYIAKYCIKPGTDSVKVAHFLAKLFQRQKQRKKLFLMVNDVKVLRPIFEKLYDTSGLARVRFLEEAFARTQERLRASSMTEVERYKQTTRDEEVLTTNLRSTFKAVIAAHTERIVRSEAFSAYEKEIARNLFLNPNVLLILDDCASRFKEWLKVQPVLVKDLFYMGRHFNITTIILCQNDKELDPGYRKNVMCNVFTDEQSANANFMRSSNNYSKQIKTDAMRVARETFTDARNRHRKMVFAKDSASPFYTYQAVERVPFRMGCSLHWAIAARADERRRELVKAMLSKK